MSAIGQIRPPKIDMIDKIEFKTGHFQERFSIEYPAPYFGEEYGDGKSTEYGAKRDDPGPDWAGLVAKAYFSRTERASGHDRPVYRPGKARHAGHTMFCRHHLTRSFALHHAVLLAY